MNRNIEYEIFTQEIYQRLIATDEGLKNLVVQHNVQLIGKSGQSHQIDVFWEYEIGGVKNKVAIECKNYNNTVAIGKVRDFAGVLMDLNNVNGIMVTKKGYQAGAITYANHHGINLKELREPKDEDWKGRIKTINIVTHMVLPRYYSLTPIIDVDWVKKNIKFPENGALEYSLSGMNNEVYIYDKDDAPIIDFKTLEDKLPHDWKAAKSLQHTYDFSEGYLKVNNVGKIKILGIKYEYDVLVATNSSKITAEETTKVILKDAINGDIKFFNKNGSIK